MVQSELLSWWLLSVYITVVQQMYLYLSHLPPGFVVGQSGLYQAIAMFLVAYFIICMTVLSVCAISTNGALDAGGAYCILWSCHVTATSLTSLLLTTVTQSSHSLVPSSDTNITLFSEAMTGAEVFY